MALEVESEGEWYRLLESASPGGKLVIVYFTASWCSPCRVISPAFYRLSIDPKYKSLVFVQVDVDKMNGVAMEFGIKNLPTFIVFKEGKPVDILNSPAISKLVELVERAAKGGPYEK